MIKTAIIPAAGFGTRLKPLTAAQPKEMLPLVDRPVIEWVILEAIGAGIERIIVIIGHHKTSIMHHLSDVTGFKERNNIKTDLKIEFVTQTKQKGLGHAILQTKEAIDNESFLVLLGDTVCNDKSTNPSSELIKIYEKNRNSIFSLLEVPKTDVSKFGIVEVNEIKLKDVDSDVFEVLDLIEKPPIGFAPSNFAILGRYIFEPIIFDYLIKTEAGFGGEIQLTDAMRELNINQRMHAVLYRGKRFDIGSVDDWIYANYHLTKKSSYFKNLEI